MVVLTQMTWQPAGNARRLAVGDLEGARIRSFVRQEIIRIQRGALLHHVAKLGWPEAKQWCRACRHAADTRCPLCPRFTCADCSSEHAALWHGDA